jgi:hypothetical protein
VKLLSDLLFKVLNAIPQNLAMPGRDIFDVIFSLAISTIVALVISQIYKHTNRGMNFELSFMSTLVLLAPIVTVVMLFIRGDLVLSLGLIGSLSIIRFRTPIKDTRDMVFLFWAIAVGLGSGTYNWTVVIIASIFISIVTYGLYFLRYGRSHNTDFILVVSGNQPGNNEKVENIIKSYTEEARVRSHELENGNWEIIFELRFPRIVDRVTNKLVSELEELEGVQKVSLLAPQLALPV